VEDLGLDDKMYLKIHGVRERRLDLVGSGYGPVTNVAA
jgi:hypothetical protein